MFAVMVVVIEPAVKCVGERGAGAVDRAIGPAAEEGADEAFGFAVGLGSVRPPAPASAPAHLPPDRAPGRPFRQSGAWTWGRLPGIDDDHALSARSRRRRSEAARSICGHEASLRAGVGRGPCLPALRRDRDGACGLHGSSFRFLLSFRGVRLCREAHEQLDDALGVPTHSRDGPGTRSRLGHFVSRGET